MLKKYVKIGLTAAVIGYISFCLAVYFYPQYFFYNPLNKRADLEQAIADGFLGKEVNYLSADNTKLYGWFVPPTLFIFMATLAI